MFSVDCFPTKMSKILDLKNNFEPVQLTVNNLKCAKKLPEMIEVMTALPRDQVQRSTLPYPHPHPQNPTRGP